MLSRLRAAAPQVPDLWDQGAWRRRRGLVGVSYASSNHRPSAWFDLCPDLLGGWFLLDKPQVGLLEHLCRGHAVLGEGMDRWCLSQFRCFLQGQAEGGVANVRHRHSAWRDSTGIKRLPKQQVPCPLEGGVGLACWSFRVREDQESFGSPLVHPPPVLQGVRPVVGGLLLVPVSFGDLQDAHDLLSSVLEPFRSDPWEVLCPQIEEPHEVQAVVEIHPVPLVLVVRFWELKILVIRDR